MNQRLNFTESSLKKHYGDVTLTLARTFSNEAGLTSEKQMRNTSWWGEKRQQSEAVSTTSCWEQ